MAVNESNTLIHTKDENGDTTIHYPITKSDNVTLTEEVAAALGLASGTTTDEALEKLVNKADNSLNLLATYYTTTSNMSADDLTDGHALIPVSADVNGELYNIVRGTFAYVITLFYINRETTARRMQLAFSYNAANHKMAFRIYGSNGWLAWKEMLDSSSVVPVANGGTGATTAADALGNLGAAVKDGYGFVDSGTDVRTLSANNGWYMLSTDRSYTNIPAAANGMWCVLDVQDKTAMLKVINGGVFYNSNLAGATANNWTDLVSSEPPTLESLGAAPAYTYGTEDLQAGVSPLETGKLHFVHE